jgi:hypothetical protein
MAKQPVEVFKLGKKVYIKGEKLLITLPFDTETFLQIYNGDKVTLEIEVTEKHREDI